MPCLKFFHPSGVFTQREKMVGEVVRAVLLMYKTDI